MIHFEVVAKRGFAVRLDYGYRRKRIIKGKTQKFFPRGTGYLVIPVTQLGELEEKQFWKEIREDVGT